VLTLSVWRYRRERGRSISAGPAKGNLEHFGS
jgi:hypothetical protein